MNPRISPLARFHRPCTPRAFYATTRNIPQRPAPVLEELAPVPDNDFILSILRANPSLRDARSYLASFGPRPVAPKPSPAVTPHNPLAPSTLSQPQTLSPTKPETSSAVDPNPIVKSILDPVQQHTALVKIQGPFTDVQLDSIARGMVYLEKLGLVSVIVVENDEFKRGDVDERELVVDETMRVVKALEKHGTRARPVLGPVVRLGPKPGEEDSNVDFVIPEAHAFSDDLTPLRSALRAGEIPVLAPFALDSFCRSIRIAANAVIGGLAQGMVQAEPSDVDLTPLRLMIINREGGLPSYARDGYPHLLINMTQEFHHIHESFQSSWRTSHPTAIANLSLARTCLAYMPPTSSAVMVSHRSPSSLIANLITNKPAVSSSLPHALLQGNRKLTPHTPTLLRRGLPIQVLRSLSDIDRPKLKHLLEQSFGRALDEPNFYRRLEKTLDFVIIAGDYAGAVIVTNEHCPGSDQPIQYLDKFAVLPSHQGDGTVDFLWVALHDESYGLGHPFSANPNGGKGGEGEGRDLVWRSRANNPVNPWYFDRSTGHVRQGDWVLFWCDAEKHLKIEEGRKGSAGLSFIEHWEQNRLALWTDAVMKIPSSWKPLTKTG